MKYSSKYDLEAIFGFPIIAFVVSSIAFMVMESHGIEVNLSAFLSISMALGIMIIMIWDIRRLEIENNKVKFIRLFSTKEYDISEIKEIWDYNGWSLYSRRLLIVKLKNNKRLQVKETRNKAFDDLKKEINELELNIEFKKIRK